MTTKYPATCSDSVSGSPSGSGFRKERHSRLPIAVPSFELQYTMGLKMPFSPSFPVSYSENLVQTIKSMDSAKVSQAIEWLPDARDQGKSIFVAGNGGSAA